MRPVLVFFAVVVLVACAAALGTHHFMDHRVDRSDDTMHLWLHEKLDLAAEQVKALEQLEIEFAADEKRLRNNLDEANRRLATIIREDSSYTPRVAEAVEQVHHFMGELQKLSISHLFAMRGHLTDEQNEKLMHFAEMALTDAH